MNFKIFIQGMCSIMLLGLTMASAVAVPDKRVPEIRAETPSSASHSIKFLKTGSAFLHTIYGIVALGATVAMATAIPERRAEMHVEWAWDRLA
ncbi:hypothetical protein CVT26_006493 [Gymnopilus dilepis]|uniref:DUF1772 domain-containing protein n=1 Tax=Gymnopilus dilepis TaxID=231916 RepID=A0A409W6E9_9AGAR|nr:hypothetical protein CVT26_006493 [Gymnopilus dilepis]